MKIGLVGWHTRTGLGTQNRDLAVHLPCDVWVVPAHPLLGALEAPPEFHGMRVEPPWGRDLGVPPSALKALSEMDWVLFAEQPYYKDLVPALREHGVKTACYVNLEWFPPAPQGVDADLLLAPTKHTHEVLRKEGWRPVVYAPMGVDTQQFPFRQRGGSLPPTFVFNHGFGGAYDRKGAPIVADALWHLHKEAKRAGAPTPRVIVHTQRAPKLPRLPEWVEVRGEVLDPADLYVEGDVLLAPSRFEGIGLPLLEAQSAGMVVVTSDGPPMNEYGPVICAQAKKRGKVHVARQVETVETDPLDLARIIREMMAPQRQTGRGPHRPKGAWDLYEMSRTAGACVRAQHDWPDCALTIRAALLDESGEGHMDDLAL